MVVLNYFVEYSDDDFAHFGLLIGFGAIPFANLCR